MCQDLVVKKPKVLRALSGPAQLQCELNPLDPSAKGISFKPWSHIVHVEKTILGQRKIWASCIVQPSPVDKKTGIISLTAQGFGAYPKKMPWLQNWNPLVCDVFEPVHKIWDHLQSYPNGNLNVEVYPAESGIEMLPGYAFDGNITNLNFWAMFIRASDKQDCQDNIDKLARDIPFDYVEQSAWSDDYTVINKKIFLGYPKAGVDQDNLAFIIGENVIEAAPHLETEIDWASDAVIDGWFPGQEVSSTFTNADPNRLRRVVMQDDARINSNERAQVWAKRKLTRRQTPSYWESIIIDMGHSNAPFGTFDVGDRINVRGNMPIIGEVYQQHKIIAIMVDEESQTCELTLKAEGAFNYDPIYYQGDVSGSVSLTHPAAPQLPFVIDPGTVGIS